MRSYRQNYCNVYKYAPNLDIEEIKALFNEGKNLSEISKILKSSKRTVHKFADEHGFNIIRAPLISESDEDYIIKHYEDKTFEELANEFGCSASNISRVLRKHNCVGKKRNKYYVNHKYFSTINTPVKAYFLGLIAADGCIYTRPRSSGLCQSWLSICLKSEDKYILDILR